MADDVLRSDAPDQYPISPPPRPVRQAFWLAAAGFLLVLAQCVAAAVVLAHFDDAYDAVRGMEDPDAVEAVRSRLFAGAVLAGVVTLLLGFAALTVPRRSVSSRPLVGGAALLSAVALLLGVVFSPENAVRAQTAAELARYETLLPVWFSTLSSVTVAGVILLLGLAFIRMGREAAIEYYQEYDPTAGWGGFTSWLDVIRR
ncbi:hypothetical protein AB0K00_43005 [Dactylosporangium sp. NPDC049525]|uniref:hypothetical protein n=1 Tax=Dactylosporangium sp. NPDC049525 TaxID=3154730 RepID=UPI003430727D